MSRLIGRNGCLVRLIVDKFNVRVNFKPQGNNYVVEITGHPKSTQKAVNQLVNNLESELNHPHMIIFKFPLSHIHIVIGKNGSRLTSYSKTFGIQITVRPEQDEACCRINGQIEQCQAAKAAIMELIEKNSVSISRRLKIPSSYHKQVDYPLIIFVSL